MKKRRLKSLAPERELICLFGCTGDRDRTQRPEMAEISENLADKIFVTADDNHSEPIDDIMEVTSGVIYLPRQSKLSPLSS